MPTYFWALYCISSIYLSVLYAEPMITLSFQPALKSCRFQNQLDFLQMKLGVFYYQLESIDQFWGKMVTYQQGCVFYFFFSPCFITDGFDGCVQLPSFCHVLHTVKHIQCIFRRCIFSFLQPRCAFSLYLPYFSSLCSCVPPSSYI